MKSLAALILVLSFLTAKSANADGGIGGPTGPMKPPVVVGPVFPPYDVAPPGSVIKPPTWNGPLPPGTTVIGNPTPGCSYMVRLQNGALFCVKGAAVCVSVLTMIDAMAGNASAGEIPTEAQCAEARLMLTQVQACLTDQNPPDEIADVLIDLGKILKDCNKFVKMPLPPTLPTGGDGTPF